MRRSFSIGESLALEIFKSLMAAEAPELFSSMFSLAGFRPHEVASAIRGFKVRRFSSSQSSMADISSTNTVTFASLLASQAGIADAKRRYGRSRTNWQLVGS
jgi:hypothetical protein